MPDLREKRVELILQQLEELPTLPAVALRVLQVTADDTSSAAEVVRLIGSDPALTTRILQLIRRADVGVRGDVTSIERAVLLLGFDAIRGAVLAVLFAPPLARAFGWKQVYGIAALPMLIAIVLLQVFAKEPTDSTRKPSPTPDTRVIRQPGLSVTPCVASSVVRVSSGSGYVRVKPSAEVTVRVSDRSAVITPC